MDKITPLTQEQIENHIFIIRGEQVMLDRDLAKMYQVKATRLREQVKRNINRFPSHVMFQLTDGETNNMVSQNAIPSRQSLGGHKPYAFTEQGVAMLSSVLRSDTAIKVNIRIMDAFVQMRKLVGQATLQQLRLYDIENKLLEHDQKFEKLFIALENNDLPQKGILFDGQIFDAYSFIAKLIKTAKKSLLLIDNYIDESVLTLFTKREEGVEFTCYTQNISKALQLDIEKHNLQYPPVCIKKLKSSHDRFLLIDDKELYHFGASLKDLGKKWFAFSKMDSLANDMLQKLTETEENNALTQEENVTACP
jgi:hypothetical protein